MRVLLLGRGGMLATDLLEQTPSGIELHALGRDELDVTDGPHVERTIDTIRPAWIINATGYTRVDEAERNRDAAFAVNADAVGVVARCCARLGIRIAHFSTDYVFDGLAPGYREHAARAPLSVYGASKAAGEDALLASGARALLVRTSWLFGRHGRSFPRTMWARAQAKVPTRVVNDQHGRPTYSSDLAATLWRLVARDADGIFHVANAGVATWYDVAKRVFTAAGAEEVVTTCRTSDYPTAARRPECSVLDTAKLSAAVGRLPPWEESLDRFLVVLQGEVAAAEPDAGR